MTGIYKILSPSGKVYIGQSIDIKGRWRRHKSLLDTTFLANSLKKYGFDNHFFSVIHELPDDVQKDVLTTYEQLYIDLYKDCGISLLNSRDAGLAGRPNEVTRRLLSLVHTGKKHSEDHKRNNSEAKKGDKCYMFGIAPEKHPQARRVVNVITGEVFGTVKQAAKSIGMKRTTLIMQLRGHNTNKTGLTYDA